MVGKLVKCPDCGTRLKSDYQFCNVCGYRLSDERQVCLRPVPKKVAPSTSSSKILKKSKKNEAKPISRKNLVTSLLALMALVPFTPWISVFEGAFCFYASKSEVLYGQYITYLALAGLLIAYSERFIPNLIIRRMGLAGIGFGALGIIVSDFLQIMDVLNDPMVPWALAEPGLGMYMGAAFSIGLIISTLLPEKERSRSARSSAVQVLRPGSPGSGP
jgi:hypothetical protein